MTFEYELDIVKKNQSSKYLLSGHTDTLQANRSSWTTKMFIRNENNRLYTHLSRGSMFKYNNFKEF